MGKTYLAELMYVEALAPASVFRCCFVLFWLREGDL